MSKRIRIRKMYDFLKMSSSCTLFKENIIKNTIIKILC